MPELLVTDLAASLRFWCGACGFAVLYDRPEEGFARLHRDGAQVMLEAVTAPGRHWVTAPLVAPLGRGLHFQIEIAAPEPILDALAARAWPLWLAPEENLARAGGEVVPRRQGRARPAPGPGAGPRWLPAALLHRDRDARGAIRPAQPPPKNRFSFAQNPSPRAAIFW